MEREHIIRELVAQTWDPSTIEVWVRAKFRCEYCNKALSESSDEYFYGAHVDHVVPGAGNALTNLALACRACNFIKRKQTFAASEFPPTTAEGRTEIIKKASEYITGIRARNTERLKKQLPLLQSLIQI